MGGNGDDVINGIVPYHRRLGVEMAATEGVQSVLEPFHQRASEAEDRLSRLEAAVAGKMGDANANSNEPSSTVKDLQSKIKLLEAELADERKEAGDNIQKLKTENAKHQYRILHLVRALEEADSKIASK